MFISSNVVMMIIYAEYEKTNITITALEYAPTSGYDIMYYTLNLNIASNDNWWIIHRVL